MPFFIYGILSRWCASPSNGWIMARRSPDEGRRGILLTVEVFVRVNALPFASEDDGPK
jgi:hypothetical protein